MKVRNHPLMTNAKGRIWPPIWKEKYGKTSLTGEIGVLMHVAADSTSSRTIYVHMTNEKLSYIGRLIFDNARFCQRMAIFLKNQVGRTICEISDLEL